MIAAPVMARFLHVRRSELERTLEVAGFAMLVGWAMYTAFNATQAIFLYKTGPRAYPLFFIVLALAVWPLVALQGALTRRFGVGRTLRYNLVLNAITAPILFVVYRISEAPAVAFAVYVVYSVAFELVMLNFWAFVSQYFNVLEGKRVFPVIAAGSSIGYILAGATTTVVAIIATEPLLFVWMIGTGAAAWMSAWLERRLYRPSLADDADELLAREHAVTHKHGPIQLVRAAFQYVTGSRLVLALIVLAFALQIASRTGDYLVAQVFVQATHSNLQALTILLGNAWLASYVVQLGISLFITPIVLDRLGVKNAIMTLPVFTLIGFAAVAINPILATSLFLFIVRNGLQTGLDDPAESVLGGALPAQVGPKLTVLLNNLVLPGAAVTTGIVLIVVQRLTTEGVQVLALFGLVFSVLFILAAFNVRRLYVGAIYSRLRSHALSLSDFQQAMGRPTQSQLDELVEFIRTGDEKARRFAAGMLGELSPETLTAMLPEMLNMEDAVIRRIALELAQPAKISDDQLNAAADDADGWVIAAAAVAGAKRDQPWERSKKLLADLSESSNENHRAAAVWAAPFLGDGDQVVAGLKDESPRVRMEGVRSFARLKGDVPRAAVPMIACLTDDNIEVRRVALREAGRWAPGGDNRDGYSEALVTCLASGDKETRRLASEAMAVQAPEALALVLPLLESRADTASAAVEALVRSGRPDLSDHVRGHLVKLLADGLKAARLAARVDKSDGHAFLQLAIDDYVDHVVESSFGALRALHGKRGFATVEHGLRSGEPRARVEGVETLLNFGPGWLAGPLAQLLDPAFDPGTSRNLSRDELEALQNHPDKWIKEAAEAAQHGIGEGVKELIALKKVPLFSTLTLEQLASIDRLMVTRHYAKGETIFTRGDVGTELYVVQEGGIRVHLDHEGTEVTLAKLGPSMVLGEMAVFDDQPRSASAVASEDTTVRVLRRDRLQAIVYEHPEVLLEFVKNLSQRIRVMNEQLESADGAKSAPGAVGTR